MAWLFITTPGFRAGMATCLWPETRTVDLGLNAVSVNTGLDKGLTVFMSPLKDQKF